MRQRIACLHLGLWIVAAASQAAALTQATPHDVVAAIYAREIADERAGGRATAFTDHKLRDELFSKGFNALIMRDEATAEREKGVGEIDFDPIISGQDGKVKKLTIATDTIAEDRAIVSAHFVSLGQATVVTYHLVKANGRWVVEDITGKLEKDAWSVRDILESAERKK